MDILTRKVDKEQDLKSWLDQLNENGKSDARQSNIDTSSRFEFDSILGELDDLEKQFDVESTDEPSHYLASVHPISSAEGDNQNMSQALEEFSLINSQLEDVLQDLAGFAGKPAESFAVEHRIKPLPPPVPVKAPKFSQSSSKNHIDESSSNKSLQKAHDNLTSTKDSLVIPTSSANKFNSEKVEGSQSYVNVHLADGSLMGFSVTNKTTIGDLYSSVMNGFINSGQKYFTIWEILPDLAMERELEVHLHVLEKVLNFWSKNSKNKILMKLTKLPTAPTNLKGDLKGTLHVKIEEKKSWKAYTFIMKTEGLFYYSKAKGKVDPICYLGLKEVLECEVFFGVGWKKRFKAPSEFGFAIKPLKVQEESDREIKYFCADSEALRAIWASAIKQMLCSETHHPVESICVKAEPPTHFEDVSHYSEPFEANQRFQSRRISNASTSSGKGDLDDGMLGSSVKKIANLPITTETTRFLQSMQSTAPNQRPPVKQMSSGDHSPVLVLHKDHLLQEKNQKNRQCSNEYAPSPYTCKTPEVYPKSPQQKPNVIKTLPKPNRTLSHQSTIIPLLLPPPPPPPSDQDFPPPPLSMTGPPYQHQAHPSLQYQTLPMQSKSKSLPPPPPKRDQSTRLTCKPNEFYASVQTRNFILNLDRTIGQKRALGAEGLCKVEMPLPPPPVVSHETSYIDLGDLPPPPAELLQGLKCMRTNPGLFQSAQRW